MNILGIESSCDDTAAAIVRDGHEVLSSVINSQVDIFAAYGGVIPEVAARSHLEAILPVIHQALDSAKLDWPGIDAIAVTHAPGLLGSLLIGTLTARTLAVLHNKSFYPIHHLKSHVYANWLEGGEGRSGRLMSRSAHQSDLFPLLALVVSGGHTQILYMPSHNHFEIIGSTRDDAIGESFDKVAKILGLPYPGGPSIANAAKNGDPTKYRFPHPSVPGLDFSFSGLKTAVLRSCQESAGGDFRTPSHELKNLLTDQQKNDLAASFQLTAIDILIEKLRATLSTHPANSILVAGGVSANQLLREKLTNQNFGLPVFFPAPQYSGDNGAMVAAAAFYEINSDTPATDPYHLDIYPRIAINA